jgi:TANFOR domain-containing protein
MKKALTKILFAPLLFSAGMLQAQQVKVQVNLLPPYSPYFSDYLTYQNKAVITVTNSVVAPVNQIYFSGSIEGLDNGLKLETKPGYKPSVPINLNSTVTILTGNDVVKYYSYENIAISGDVTLADIVQNNGLPEGQYKICLRAYDWSTNQPVSPADEGCATILIQQVEPPVPVFPMCEGMVAATESQFVNFSWSPAPGAPPGTGYILHLAEMTSASQNPNDALNTAPNIVFFSKTVYSLGYNYQLADPKLYPGRYYAWRITAFDPAKNTVFRNGGMSNACTFLYQYANYKDSSLLPKDKLLSISSPMCKSSMDTMKIGTYQSAGFAWNWAMQQTDPELLKDPTKLKVNGRRVANYRILIEPVSKGLPSGMKLSKTSLTGLIGAPKQTFNLNKTELTSAGLIIGHPYMLTITALDSLDFEMAKTSSCTFVFQDAKSGGLPQVELKGRLVYKFQMGNEINPANHTSVTMQLVRDTVLDASQTPLSKMGYAGASGGINPKRPFVSITSTADGTFTGSLGVTRGDTGKLFLKMVMNSPYYRMTRRYLPVNMAQNSGADADGIPSMQLGDIYSFAYGYTLTVDMAKGFPSFFYDTLTKGLKQSAYSIDTLSINSKAKIPAGMTVALYRKKKNQQVPFYEGGKYVGAFETKGSGDEALVKVTEAKTFIDKVGFVEKTRVKFNLLVCNMQPDDEYYLKAIIPSKSTGGGQSTGTGKFKVNTGSLYFAGDAASQNPEDLEELEAPLQMVKFTMSKFKKNTLHYEETVIYKLISKTPPMSKISGKLSYRWPSEPGVLRPLPNAKFSVVVKYLMDGQPLTGQVKQEGCKTHFFNLQMHSGSDSDDEMIPISEQGLVVGTGTTDAQGNFTIYVINHNKKGTVSTDAVWKHMATIDHCNKDQQKKDFFSKKGYPDDDWSYGQNEFNQWDNNMNTGNQGQNGTLDFGFDGLNGMNGTFGNVQGNMNGIMNNLGGSVGKVGAGLKGKSFGPMPEFEMETEDGPMKLDRMFSIALDYDWDIYYQIPVRDGAAPSSIGNQFAVQAFETKDLGLFVADVDEERNRKIKVKMKYSDGTAAYIPMDGIKMVVFRLPNSKTPNKPEGEGTADHPMKALMQADFSGQAGIEKPYGNNMNQYGNMEWILDYSIGVNASAKEFNISNLKLLKPTSAGKYYLQISPDPQNQGITFLPKIIPYYDDEVTITLLPSRITGRLLDKSSAKGLKIGKVSGKVGTTFYEVPVFDTSGYFEIINGKTKTYPFSNSKISWNDGSTVQIKATAAGYKTMTVPNRTINKEGNQENYTFPLDPAGRVKGTIVNENGNPIEAWIMRDDSAVFESGQVFIAMIGGKPKSFGAGFNFPITSGMHKLTIIPKDPAYFDTTLKSILIPEGVKDLGEIMVYRRKHRINVVVQLLNAQGNPIITGGGMPANLLRATINNDSKLSKTNSMGGFYFEFENVSVNNYSLLVENAGNGGYIPAVFNLKNQESRTPVNYYITIRQGGTISGNVTLDGKPVKNARVYLEKTSTWNAVFPTSGSTAMGELETRTDAAGKYTIKGVPNIAKIIVKATHDTSFTVNGDKKEIALSNGSGSADLALTSFTDMFISKLHGFPISIEKVEKASGGRVLVTGLVDLGKGSSSFTWLDPNTKVRVTGIEYVKLSDGTGKAKNADVEMDVASLKMKYQNRYNVKIAPKSTGSKIFNPLRIKESGDGGVMMATVSITDNSFNYPSTYLSFNNTEFYFGIAAGSGSTLETEVRTITSASGFIVPQYKICDPAGKAISFKFIGFNATANPANSYIDNNGKIHLETTLKGMLQSGQGVVDIKIPDLEIDNNSVKPATGSAPLLFKLQTWTLEVKDWKVDPTEGGIVSTNCLVKTGVVDVPAKTFNLRHNMFVLKDFKLEKLTLGGGVLDLTEVSSNAILVFDEKCGSDLGAHWRLAIAGIGDKPAAKIKGLPADIPVTEIPINYIQLISYGVGANAENILTLGTVPGGIKKIFNNDRLTFDPKAIISGNGSFTITGDLKFNVPRMNLASFGVIFSKSGIGLKAEPGSIITSFEAPGYVRYTSDASKLPEIDRTNGIMTLWGSVEEPGKLRPIECKMVFGTGSLNKGRIYLTPDKKLHLLSSTSADGLSVTIGNATNRNGMWVSGNDWNLLRFNGELNDPKSSGMSSKPKPIMDFMVHGEIKANSEKLEVDNIQTPFGNLAMSYDFAAKELRGTLEIPDGTQIGNYKFGGSLETRFGDNGFVICGSGQLNTGTLFVDGFGTFNAGFLLANYTLDDALIKKVTTYSLNPAEQCWLQDNKSGFKGFYFCGGYQIINIQEGFDAGIVAVYLHAMVGVEASLGLNFGKPAKVIRISVGAQGKVEAGMSAITGTSIEGSIVVKVMAAANYTSGVGFGLDAKANATVDFEVCQFAVAGDICFGASKAAGIDFGFGPSCKKGKAYFEFHLGDPGSLDKCTP